MALDNKTVLENLTKQREDIMKQIDTARTTLLKLDGAIDVLSQIEEANEVKETEVVVPENE
jgi:hypothetical protein